MKKIWVGVMKIQNQQNLKNNNEKMILEIIKIKGKEDISQADIVKITHMSPTSISRIVENLINKGLVRKEDSITTDKVGRKGTKLKLVSERIITVGVSIDSDNLGICAIDFLDRLIASDTVTLQKKEYTPDEIIDIIYDMFEKLCEANHFDREKIQAVGISCIGNVDYRKGDIYFAPQFGWNHIDFGNRAEKRLKRPIYMENDLKAAITSVVHQEKKYLKEDVTYLSVGMGVGSAVMLHGKIVRGSDNAFGEVGHVIINPEGRKCDCGQRGCVQTTLTHDSLIKECQEAELDINTTDDIFDAYRRREEWALTFIDKTAADLAMLIRNIVYMYNTNYILVGGAIILDFPELLELAKKKVCELIHYNLYSSLHIVQVKTRNNSMTGAAFIAQSYCVDRMIENEVSYNLV